MKQQNKIPTNITTMIAIYNPNSDPIIQRFPLPTATEKAEFDNIAGFLKFLSNERTCIETIILSDQTMREGMGHATSQNIATIKKLLPHTNHYRGIISSTYGTDFAGKNIYNRPSKGSCDHADGARMLAKLLVRDYSNTSPDDAGDLVGMFAGKVNFLTHPFYSNREYMEKLYRYFYGLDISVNKKKLS